MKNSSAVIYDKPRLSVSEEECQPVSASVLVDTFLAPRRQAAVANVQHYFFWPDAQDGGNQVSLQLKAGCRDLCAPDHSHPPYAAKAALTIFLLAVKMQGGSGGSGRRQPMGGVRWSFH
jgi:hypothetical protein